MSDVWSWWRDALAGKNPEVSEASPQCGFYKLRDGKDGPWLPVMIRYDGEELRARVADNSADPFAIWVWCAKHPVSKEDAKTAFETGRFPGEVAVIGDNSGALSLADQIVDYANQALAWLRSNTIADAKSKDMAANYRAELLRLRKDADASREAEKRPYLDASRAVDAKFKPLIDTADAAANELRDALTVYMREEEKRLEAERRAKWEAEQRAIAEARKAAEEARAKKLAEDPIAALTDPEPVLPEPPPMPEPVKVQAGGQRGRKTGLREVTRFEITDYAAALAHVKDHPDVIAAVEKAAFAQAKAGATVPGVRTFKEKVAA